MGNECIDKQRLIGHLVRLPERVGLSWFGRVKGIVGDEAEVHVSYRTRRGRTMVQDVRVPLIGLRLAAELPNGKRSYIP